VQQRYAEQIKKASRRAAELTRQLLAFSRKQILYPAILDLNAVVRDVGKILQRLIGEDVQIVTDLETSLDSTRADREQIEQILMNLATNARDVSTLAKLAPPHTATQTQPPTAEPALLYFAWALATLFCGNADTSTPVEQLC
jgi:C4-dicarboxylate-specific signal transduction histidine kinase